MSGQSARSNVLRVRDLRVDYAARTGVVHAVAGVDLEVDAGEVLGIVGESGSGKSSMARTIVGLLPPVATVHAGSVEFTGTSGEPVDLVRAGAAQWRTLRRRDVAFMPQACAAALDPLRRIGRQLVDVLRLAHPEMTRDTARTTAAELLEGAGLRDVERVLRRFPHELSGGMAQRVALCLVLARRPRLLVADEPTSGLDVRVLRQVMDLLIARCTADGTATVLVTHNIGVVAQYCTKVAVVYGGEVVESGAAGAVLGDPQHAYTRALLGAVPRRGEPLAAPYRPQEVALS